MNLLKMILIHIVFWSISLHCGINCPSDTEYECSSVLRSHIHANGHLVGSSGYRHILLFEELKACKDLVLRYRCDTYQMHARLNGIECRMNSLEYRLLTIENRLGLIFSAMRRNIIPRYNSGS